jgi:hypothetical protein
MYPTIVVNTDRSADVSELSARLRNTYEGFVTSLVLRSIVIHSCYKSVIVFLYVKRETGMFKLWGDFHSIFTKTVGNIRPFQLQKATAFVFLLLSFSIIHTFSLIVGITASLPFHQERMYLNILMVTRTVLTTTTVIFLPQLEDLK